jgi:hypothetical protein
MLDLRGNDDKEQNNRENDKKGAQDSIGLAFGQGYHIVPLPK